MAVWNEGNARDKSLTGWALTIGSSVQYTEATNRLFCIYRAHLKLISYAETNVSAEKT